MIICAFTDNESAQWKPTAKEGRAKCVYEGVCQDAEVFGAMIGLPGSPTFKTMKMSKNEFQTAFGSLDKDIR